jgi:hypothetical protein
MSASPWSGMMRDDEASVVSASADLRGYRITHQTPILWHFTARFETL